MLVVDDDGDWRALVADTLADEGFVVATAGDGRAACDCVRRVQPEVVVTDVEMPFMDGYELLAKLRCLDRGLPVIVMSADDAGDASRFSDAFRFIRKPATIDAVMVAVNEALLRRRRTRLRGLLDCRSRRGSPRSSGYQAANRWARQVRRDRRCRGRSCCSGCDRRDPRRGRIVTAGRADRPRLAARSCPASSRAAWPRRLRRLGRAA